MLIVYHLPPNRPETLAANVAAWQALFPTLPRQELLRKLAAAGTLIMRSPQNVKVQLMETAALLGIAEQASAQLMSCMHWPYEAGSNAYIHCRAFVAKQTITYRTSTSTDVLLSQYYN